MVSRHVSRVALFTTCLLLAQEPAARRMIRLKSVTLDPMTAEQRRPSEGWERWIVQLHRPPTRDDRQVLTSRYDLKLDSYIPDTAYLEKVSATVAERLRSSELVRWVGPYLPEYKMDPRTANQPAGSILVAEGFADLTVDELVSAVKRAGLNDIIMAEKPRQSTPRVRFRTRSSDDARIAAAVPGVYLVEPAPKISIDERR